jgi:NNP family nitrate/nitrite transporter-like MFS transporter
VLGSLPVMAIGLAQSFPALLVFRLLIGAIGASFVVTQFHTSLMFAPNCVGTANATTAGWGNLGGGVTQFAMPLLFAAFVALGFSPFWGWRLSMLVAGLVCLLAGVAYARLTQDTPEGNFRELRAAGRLPNREQARGTFLEACRDRRTWLLFALYGCCFGMELTIKNVAALYFTDYFGLGLQAAGFAAAAYGMMNLFARTLGGYVSDRWAQRWGLAVRGRWLFLALLGEGMAVIAFSRAGSVWAAVALLIVVGLFVQMANGATYAVVPFVNRRALGSVSGIVGAGGNAGAVAFGFLFQGGLSWPTVLLLLGGVVTLGATLALFLRLERLEVAEPVMPTEESPVDAVRALVST